MGVESKQAKAFMAAKDALQDDALLVHYDSSKQLVLACNASPYGLGAVLSHIMEDGLEKPIAYASRTLTAAEKNYSQLEKEVLAVVYAVGKFHNYLYGRQFVIESDHQPLSYIFSDSKAIYLQHLPESRDGHLLYVLILTLLSTSLERTWVMLTP